MFQHCKHKTNACIKLDFVGSILYWSISFIGIILAIGILLGLGYLVSLLMEYIGMNFGGPITREIIGTLLAIIIIIIIFYLFLGCQNIYRKYPISKIKNYINKQKVEFNKYLALEEAKHEETVALNI